MSRSETWETPCRANRVAAASRTARRTSSGPDGDPAGRRGPGRCDLADSRSVISGSAAVRQTRLDRTGRQQLTRSAHRDERCLPSRGRPVRASPHPRPEMTLHDERSGSGDCPRKRTQDATSAVFDEHAPRVPPIHGAEVPRAFSRWIVGIGDAGPPTPGLAVLVNWMRPMCASSSRVRWRPNSAEGWCPRVTFGLGSARGDESSEFAALGVPFEGVDGVDVNVWVGESEFSEFVRDGH